MKPKVMIVGPIPPPFHGCSVATQWLLQSPLADVYQVIHLDTSDHRNLDNLGKWDVRNILIALTTVLRAAMLCLVQRPAVVYVPISQNTAGFVRDGLLILSGAVLARARVIVHLHGAMFLQFYENASPPMRAFIDITMKRVHQGVVLGQALKPHLEKWIRTDRIAVVPNGTDCDRLPSTRGPSKEALSVVFLGNHLKFKGIVDVVAIAAEATSARTDVRFRFAGRWTDDPICGASASEIEAECTSIIRQSGRPESFEFLGELDREQVCAFLGSADILMLPSYQEGLPLVLLEAMAAGIPVITSRHVGAIDDVVVDGVTGLLVTPGDRVGLRAALESLLANGELRTRMGQAARERCVVEYSQGAWAERLRLVVDSAMAVAA